MGLAAHNFESSFNTLPPGEWMRPTDGGTQRPSWACVLLNFVEQANKYNQFDFAFDVHSSPVDPLKNAAARAQDVPIYLCPSDPTDARFSVPMPDGSTQQMGRLNYFANVGAVSDCRIIDGRAGIFNGEFSSVQPGQKPKGLPIAQIPDGTSNTVMFAEVMKKFGDTTVVNYTTNKASGDIAVAPLLTDGRADPGCVAGSSAATRINYLGLQYHRGGIMQTNFYNHTLPPNWNRPTDAASQRYTCGDASFRRAHIAASSYHSGVVNVCLGDGSVRSVRDSVDFAVWQAVGTRGNGEALTLD
jgi:prepilin-type processing-associated H-X9-DG protein